MNPSEKIDLNTAIGKHLTGLPGITIDVARRIVAFRKRHGGSIHRWEELLSVNGFPADRIDQIKERAVLGPSAGRNVVTQRPVLHHHPGQHTKKSDRKL